MTQIQSDDVITKTMTTSGTEYETDAVVEAKTIAADGVVSLTLRHCEGQPLPAWTPGAHIDLILPNGISRQYSLMGDPADQTRWRLGILREPASRGGSAYVHDQLAESDTVRVRGPRNHFELKEAPAYHFIAGGIGVTPILPMIRHAEATAATWTMTYGGRQRTSMAFLTELDVFSEKVTILPQDEAGLPDLPSIIGNLAKGTVIYCCGPEGLLSAVENVCMEIGAPPPRLERFAPKKITERENTAFDVVLQESGKTFRVPADRSILDVLRDGGIDTIASCEEGTCGTCETGVLEGTPEHRDSVLTSAEQAANEFMMICVSRSCSDCLVLEL